MNIPVIGLIAWGHGTPTDHRVSLLVAEPVERYIVSDATSETPFLGMFGQGAGLSRIRTFMTHLDRVNWEPAKPPNRAGVTGIPDMAWRVLPQESVRAVQGARHGVPGSSAVQRRRGGKFVLQTNHLVVAEVHSIRLRCRVAGVGSGCWR